MNAAAPRENKSGPPDKGSPDKGSLHAERVFALPYRALAWNLRTREMLHAARRYSKFVKFMKRALPLAALALGAVVVLYMLQPRESGRMALTFERLGRIEGDLAMVNPRLTGIGDDGLPFMISAASAVQEGRGAGTVHLVDVMAEINLKGENSLQVTAANGVADTGNHLLELSGGIHVSSSDGYDVRTEAASADLKAGLFHGESPVEVESRFGRVTAKRFALNRQTKQIQFWGDVRMVLYGMPTPNLRKPDIRKDGQ